MANELPWFSERKLAELDHERRVELFDRFIDLALEGAVSIDEAVGAYKETLEFEGLSLDDNKT